MATNYSTRPPPKEIPFTELLPSGEQFVTNPWYTWALNIRQAVDTLRVIVGDPDGDGVVTDVNRLLTDDVAVFAPRMTPTVTGGCGALTTIEFAPTQPNLYALPFAAGVDTSADFGTMLPFYWAGKTFKVWVYWGHGGSGTAWDVKWEVVANTTFDNESIILDFVPGITVLDTGGTSGNLYIARSEAVPITSYENEEGSLVSLRITRRGTDAEDTMDITAYLLAVRFVLEGEPVFEPDVLGNDPDFASVVLLVQDGTDASLTVQDRSSYGDSVTIANYAEWDSAQQVFGANQILCTTNQADIPEFTSSGYASRFGRATGEQWTIETWVEWNTYPASSGPWLWLWYSGATDRIAEMYLSHDVLYLRNGSDTPVSCATLPADTPVFVQFFLDGSTYYVDVDGVQVATGTNAYQLDVASTYSFVPAAGFSGDASYVAVGWSTPLRVTKGIMRTRGVVPTTLFPTF